MYITEVLTKTKDGKTSHVCVLLRESYREKGKVKNRTIANLSNVDKDTLEALKIAFKKPKQILSDTVTQSNLKVQLQHSIGATWCVYQTCKKLGIERALGNSHEAKLALVQIISRVIDKGSRLSAVRLAKENSMCDILQIEKSFTEDDLYNNLAWLSKNQTKIENALFKDNNKNTKPEFFLYDVTSSYLEGVKNHFGDYGYNRDKKNGKQQIVLGLLCDVNGNPVSIKVFKGNTNDTKTFAAQIKKVQKDFGCKLVTFVGDRGMIKSGQIDDLNKNGFHYITAISKPQIETLLKKNIIQMELFDKVIYEIEDDGIRYLLRRNEIRQKEIQENREDRFNKLKTYIDKLNLYLEEHPKSKSKTALNKISKKATGLKIFNYISITEKDRTFSITEDKEKLDELAKLDGCYIIKTDLPNNIPTKTIHEKYKDLSKVEWAFRTSKTILLELRPWFVRTENSTKGHAFVVMLAYYVAKTLQEAWIKKNNSVEEALKELTKLSAIEIEVKEGVVINTIPNPTKSMQDLLDSAGVILPSAFPKSKINVDSRKKLQNYRKQRKNTK